MFEVSDTWTAPAMKRHLRSVRLAIWALLLLVAAGVMAFMPLLGVLGFEFSFVVAILASIAAADLSAAFVRKVQRAGRTPLARAAEPVRLVVGLTVRAAAVNLALLVPPLLIIAANALRVRNCDWLFGATTYLLMPALSVCLASGVGVVAALAAGHRRRLSNALPLLALLGSLLLSLWRFYAAPPVFSYNMFAGYFPGNLYDENVILGAPFYWARLFHLSAVATGLLLAAYLLDVPSLRLTFRRRQPDRRRWVSGGAALLAAALSAVVWLKSGPLGYSINAADVAEQLGGRYESDNFVIYYSLGGDIERNIELIAEDHEFRYAQASAVLGVRVPGKIRSYYFRDADEKHRLMGARNVYMAKPWREEIYVHHLGFPHDVLRHEIVHVVAGVFGDPLFHVSARRVLGLPVYFNVGFIEGIAVATDWPDHFNRELTPHQAVKAMNQLGLTPPLERIFSTGFLEFSSARSYTLAGSFVRFLLDRYGAERLRAVYRNGGKLAAVYGKDLPGLAAEWQALIDETPLPQGAAEVVRERFRHKSIFQRPCPHAIAKQRSRAADRVTQGRLDEAVELLQSVCADVPEEPRFRLELGGLYRRAGRTSDAATVLEELANDPELTSSLRAEALLDLVAIATRAGDWSRAVELLERAAGLPLEEGLRRNVSVQRFAATYGGPAGEPLRAYFWGGSPAAPWDPVVSVGRAAQIIAAEPNLALGHYLVGRALRGRGDAAATVRSLGRALDLGLGDSLVVRETARLLAEEAYVARDWARLEQAAAILLAPEQPEVTRLYGQDWLDRMHWKRTGELPARYHARTAAR